MSYEVSSGSHNGTKDVGSNVQFNRKTSLTSKISTVLGTSRPTKRELEMLQLRLNRFVIPCSNSLKPQTCFSVCESENICEHHVQTSVLLQTTSVKTHARLSCPGAESKKPNCDSYPPTPHSQGGRINENLLH